MRNLKRILFSLLGALVLLSAPASGAAALQQKLTVAGSALLGFSVAVDGNTLVLGDPADANGTGAVYVYTRSGDNWTNTAKLTASDGTSGDVLGISVAINGDTIVAGATGHAVGATASQGAVYTFARTGAPARTQTAELTATDGATNDRLGTAVATDGDTIVAGAPGSAVGGDANRGSVYTFARSGAPSRTQTAKLSALDGAAGDHLGSAVAIDGDAIVAGAPDSAVGGDAGRGSVYTFTRSGAAARTESAKLTTSTGGANQVLGTSVAIGGETIVAGAPGDAVRGNAAQGAIYTFTSAGAAARSETARLTSTNGAANEQLGAAVAISGNTIVAGAPDHTVTGNLKQGAAYTFASTGSAQRNELAILSDPVGATHALLGISVAIDSDTILAGAVGESSASVFFSPAPPPPSTPPTSPPASPPPPPLDVAPHVTHVTQSHATWRVGVTRARPGTHVRRRPVGTTFAFILDQPGRVSLAFTQKLAGRRVAGQCLAPTKANRRSHTCVRHVRVATLSFAGHRGTNRFSFSGRVSPAKTLNAGRYTLVITATNVARQRSAPRSISFTIVN
jgi:FG-GAP repeat